MVRRSPAEYYLRYLLVHPDDYPDDQIREMCLQLGLPFLGMPYLQRLRDSMVRPLPFRPQDLAHAASYRFLLRERLFWLFHPDDAMRAANQMLQLPRLKEAIETLLITRAPYNYIAMVLASRERRQCAPLAVQRFAEHYFNVDLVDTTELRALIEVRSSYGAASTDPDETALAGAFATEHRKDPRRTVARMPSPTLGTMLTSLRLGYMPANVQLANMVGATRLSAVAASLNAVMSGAAAEARDLALVAKAMHEIMVDVGSSVDEMHEDLARLMLRTETSEVPTLASLPDESVPMLTDGKVVNDDAGK